MIDVFISFTTRGAVDAEKWIVQFRQKLLDSYKNAYARELRIWDAIQKNGTGNNFITEIEKALQQTTILVTILDPAYLDSSQTLDEVQKYQEIRKDSGEYILKVIKRQGERKDEIMDFVDSNIIASFFSVRNSNNIEQEYTYDSPEYNGEIDKLVKSIRSFVLEENRRRNHQILLKRLAELRGQQLVYVALGHRSLRDERVKLINQLGETLKRNNRLPEIKVFPDDLTLSLMDYESLGQLLFDDNPYRDQCLEAMLDASTASIIPIEYNSNSEADELKRNIRHQLDVIKLKAQTDPRKRPVHILLNFPEKLRPSSPFNADMNNPAYVSYKNIRITNDQNITTFIALFEKELETALVVPAAAEIPVPGDKTIYLIEYDRPVPCSDHLRDMITEERRHRLALKTALAENFTLIPSFNVSENLVQAIEQHKEWLSISDGIIIYRGIIEEDTWCMQKQSDTYKALLQLADKRKIRRAVYVDSLQKKREKAEYSFFKYEVLVNDPADLNTFLCNLQA